MANLLDRLLRRGPKRSDSAPRKVRADAEVESIEAALAQAEDIAARTHALARDLHQLLAKGIARRRATRPAERILH